MDVDEPGDVESLFEEARGTQAFAVLNEIGATGKPTVMVFNKTDLLNGSRETLNRFLERHPHGVAVSAATGDGIPALLLELGSQVRPPREFIELA